MTQVAEEANGLLGGNRHSALLIDGNCSGPSLA
jgi:hypothetical protein